MIFYAHDDIEQAALQSNRDYMEHHCRGKQNKFLIKRLKKQQWCQTYYIYKISNKYQWNSALTIV
jgi:hypothetical protein